MRKRTGFLLLIISLFILLLSIPSLAEDCSHIWSSWSTDVYPTCSQTGSENRYCYSCDDRETRTIKATGNHDWSEWDTIISPTIKKQGTKERFCWNCDATQRAAIKRLKPFAKLNKKKLTLTVGKTYKLKVKKAAGDKVKKWVSSNKGIATVSSKGKVQAHRAGTAKIRVILKSGKKAVCTVHVKNPAVRRAASPSSSSASSSSKSTPSGGGTVYWTPGGEVYHSTPSCPTLSRSRTINSGSLASCPKGRPCKVCH